MKLLLLTVLMVVSSLALNAQEYGLASFYSDTYQGKPTAYGETYDKNKMTAAHKRHPLGTMLRVTREDNGKSVVVRVNDKGPFLPGRIVELSKAAAEKIGLLRDGVTRVRVEVVRKGEASAAEPSSPAPAAVQEDPSPPAPSRQAAASEQTEPTPPAPKPEPPQPAKSKQEDNSHYGLYKIAAAKETFTGYGVQVASMKDYLSVLRKITELEKQYFDNIHLSVERGPGRPLYKVLLGPFSSKEQAGRYAQNMRDKYQINGFVIQPESLSEEEAPSAGSGLPSGLYGIYKLSAAKKDLSGYGVQVASLTDYANVLRQVGRLDRKYFDNIYLGVLPGADGPVYKVVLAPFASKDQAARYVENMQEKYQVQGFVLDLAALTQAAP